MVKSDKTQFPTRGNTLEIHIRTSAHGLEKMFFNLKFNKYKPKYNYESGIFAGFLISKLQIAKSMMGIRRKTKLEQKIADDMMHNVFVVADTLTKKYNWNQGDLDNLVEGAFSDDEKEK